MGAKSLTTESCPLNMEAYEDGETLSEITRSFGEDHDVWNKAFMEGWEKFVENGYKEGELVSGPEYSWLGYFKQGSFDGASYPLVFTDNLKADPTVTRITTSADWSHPGPATRRAPPWTQSRST